MIEIILRRVRNSQVLLDGLLIVGTMDHTQLQLVNGRKLVLFYNIIKCFKMVILETSVRCAGDAPFEQL